MKSVLTTAFLLGVLFSFTGPPYARLLRAVELWRPCVVLDSVPTAVHDTLAYRIVQLDRNTVPTVVASLVRTHDAVDLYRTSESVEEPVAMHAGDVVIRTSVFAASYRTMPAAVLAYAHDNGIRICTPRQRKVYNYADATTPTGPILPLHRTHP
jgi:hypothetical protein